jgi:hypothetical protein
MQEQRFLYIAFISFVLALGATCVACKEEGSNGSFKTDAAGTVDSSSDSANVKYDGPVDARIDGSSGADQYVATLDATSTLDSASANDAVATLDATSSLDSAPANDASSFFCTYPFPVVGEKCQGDAKCQVPTHGDCIYPCERPCTLIGWQSIADASGMSGGIFNNFVCRDGVWTEETVGGCPPTSMAICSCPDD